jgi:xanthine/CO dehydrogenase XdhC/CoxF family maturation factor
MDLFEEVIRLRREGKRAVMATIVHTNGSIPSFESSRMLVREDGSILGTIGGGCVEAEVWAAAKDVLKAEAPRKMTFNLNNEASYDNGLICGGTLEVFVEPILPQPVLYIFGGGHVSMALVNTEARYIGMIGSKRKVLSVYQALEREGFSPDKFERVHAPVGLEIGALTPDEIAISITAELIAVRRGASGLAHKAVERARATPASTR